jgi:arylsulfatase A-like enzyme
MKHHLNRRDFLKLAGLLPLSFAVPSFMRTLDTSQPSQKGQKNVIVVVFDALSAYNISLYGYPRKTMPNLARLAEQAVVYHNHFAGSNFTTPGTASLLTGTLPWTHRAVNLRETVAEPFVTRNIFHAFQDYYRLAYSHNPAVNILLEQFLGDLEEYIPLEKLFLTNDGIIRSLFKNDLDIASVGWARAIKRKEDGYAYSLFLSHLYEPYQEAKVENLRPLFPRGLPYVGVDNYFLLEQAIDWIGSRLGAVSQPYIGYFHFLPPHSPYNTPREFYGRFGNDGWKPVDKPLDLFAQNRGGKNSFKKRTEYDEYILYVDREFGRFFDFLETSGLLENTWVVFTSDHGEMFERGISGHRTSVLYQPLLRIPLLVFEPGRKTGTNVYTPTSAIDVLPTLLHVTGQQIPDWIEGVVLPPFAPTDQDPDRNLYALQAWYNDKYAPLTIASTMLVKGRYKLIYYFGYRELKGTERIELYDIEADPEELDDLFSSQKEIASELLGELKEKLAEVNKPYL